MKRSDRTTEKYIDSLPEPSRSDIIALDKAISKVMAGQGRYHIEGKLWGGSDQEIIGYGEYTHKNRSGNVVTWHIVGLSLQKNYISVYVNAVENDKYLAEHYSDRLGKVKTGKSKISFRKLEDVDLGMLLEMVARARDITAPVT